jgi:hypothetical protein
LMVRRRLGLDGDGYDNGGGCGIRGGRGDTSDLSRGRPSSGSKRSSLTGSAGETG